MPLAERGPAASAAGSSTDFSAQFTGFYRAVLQASKCDPQKDGNNNAADAPRFYVFNKETKEPLNNGAPSESREAALQDLEDSERANAEVIEVPEGILVVRDQKPNADAPEPDALSSAA